MQLKSIKLKNFRQYINEEIIFATNKDRNITLVTGEMGAGKTTLEQAFRYVLYGISEFNNTELLNNIVKQETPVNNVVSSSVSLDFVFHDKEYNLVRTQNYFKSTQDRVTAQSSSLKLNRIIDGNYLPEKDEIALSIANRMIPQQLSDYFFADGEKIEKMSKSMKDNSKQEDFSNVVKSILGLNHFTNAIKHLKGVEKTYKQAIAKMGGEDLDKLNQEIEELDEKIISCENDIKQQNNQISIYEDMRKQLDLEIRQIPDAEKLQISYQENNRKLQILLKNLDTAKINYLNLSNNSASDYNNPIMNYFASPLIKKSLNILNEKSNINFGIPGLHASTIEHILNTGTCLCGFELHANSDQITALTYLLKTVPPYSSGVAISEFKKEAKLRVSAQSTLHDSLKMGYTRIKEIEMEIDRTKDDISLTETHLEKIDEVVDKKKRYDHFALEIDKCKNRIAEAHKKIGTYEVDRGNKKKSFDNQLLKVEATNQYMEYKEYVTFLIEKIEEAYKYREIKVRAELEENINIYLQKMYKRGISIEIDEKYRLKVNVEGAIQTDHIDSSMGQGYMIIFAFISSVIKMAREKSSEDNMGAIGEDYPLVFDAPLSNIDLEYIPKFAQTIPEIAEQVIVFLNKKDSSIFKSSCINHIGKEYELTTNGHLDTSIQEVR